MFTEDVISSNKDIIDYDESAPKRKKRRFNHKHYGKRGRPKGNSLTKKDYEYIPRYSQKYPNPTKGDKKKQEPEKKVRI